jgi:hypothetical protein
VLCVGFSPDGQRIVTGSSDKTAKMWETASGKELLTMKGQLGMVWSVAFSHDGHRMVRASLDSRAKVIEAATAQEVAAWEQEEQDIDGTLTLQNEGPTAPDMAPRVFLLEKEETAAAQSERARRAQDPGAIKQWLVLAPIPFDGQTNTPAFKALGPRQVLPRGTPKPGSPGEAALRALAVEQIPDETDLRPRAGEPISVGGAQLVWKALEQEDYRVDFIGLLGKESDWSVAYAACYIQSEAAHTGLRMKVGSDDQAKIYLNGREIYRSEAVRAFTPDEDEVATGVDLKAGTNTLVFKVVNANDGWQGSVWITDSTDQPVKGIRVILTPP